MVLLPQKGVDMAQFQWQFPVTAAVRGCHFCPASASFCPMSVLTELDFGHSVVS